MKEVFILWHTHIDERLDGGEDIKLIGVYGSEENAIDAQLRAGELEGFKDDIEGFEIVTYKLDKDNWTSGFITQTWRVKGNGTPDKRYKENKV